MNEESGKMEPCPDITCAEDIPEDLAGLRKYFEPNFEAMLIDQIGDGDKGNPREDWNITGTGLGKTSVEPRFLHVQPSQRILRRRRHANASERCPRTEASAVYSNGMCLQQTVSERTDRSPCIQMEQDGTGYDS